jgi:SAM-dependent methyltransferase
VQTGDQIHDPALSFGSVAGLYDSVRPDYPERLIDTVLGYGGLSAGARALEIGAGTGQATAQFAWRGLQIHALDPSREMVDLLLEKFDGTGLDVTASATAFESAELEPSSFDLVYCATAWHWLEPNRRWEIIADVIRPAGTLAVFYHVPLWRETDLRPQLDELYEQSGAPLEQMGPMLSHIPSLQAFASDWLADAPNPELFTDTRALGFNWSVDLAGAEYVELLGTYGDHIALGAQTRELLFDGIVELIDRSGGSIELNYSTVLLLARFTPDGERR